MERKAQQSVDTLIVIVSLIVVWDLVYRFTGSTALAGPLETLTYLIQLLTQKSFWPHIAETFFAFLWALAYSYLVGFLIGIWFGAHRASGEVGAPLLTALYSIPKVALFPIILLIMGLGTSSKVVFGALHGFIPVALFTMHAIINIRPIFLKMSKTLHLSGPQRIFYVIIPAIAPEVLASLRIGFSLTLLGILIGEMFASKRGLGFLIINAVNLADARTVLAIAILLFIFAAVANYCFLAVERRLRH